MGFVHIRLVCPAVRLYVDVCFGTLDTKFLGGCGRGSAFLHVCYFRVLSVCYTSLFHLLCAYSCFVCHFSFSCGVSCPWVTYLCVFHLLLPCDCLLNFHLNNVLFPILSILPFALSPCFRPRPDLGFLPSLLVHVKCIRGIFF